MNIFVLDKDPVKCAQYHNDKHVIKMILETAQLLCSVHHSVNPDNNAPYRATHLNHPSAIWARESIQNYNWLIELGIELGYEYTHRYGKHHKSIEVIEWCASNIPDIPHDIGLTPFALAMPEECKIGNDAVASYRKYYKTEKLHLAEWKNRDIPEWFSN